MSMSCGQAGLGKGSQPVDRSPFMVQQLLRFTSRFSSPSDTSRRPSEHLSDMKPRAFRNFENRFADIDFEQMGILPDAPKAVFLTKLWKSSGFSARGFSFNRLCEKIIALLRYSGDSAGLIRLWMYHAISKLLNGKRKIIYGDVLGLAGEVSGIYEAIFKQKTTLAGLVLAHLDFDPSLWGEYLSSWATSFLAAGGTGVWPSMISLFVKAFP